MNKELVKLPKNIVESMDAEFKNFSAERASWAIFNIINCKKNDLTDSAGLIKDYFSGDNLYQMMQALVNGYEVELTPEEKVREWFEHQQRNNEHAHTAVTSTNYDIMITAGKQILELLNIKIEGVNA